MAWEEQQAEGGVTAVCFIVCRVSRSEDFGARTRDTLQLAAAAAAAAACARLALQQQAALVNLCRKAAIQQRLLIADHSQRS